MTPTPSMRQALESADIQCLLSFIFTRFGSPADARELTDDVAAAVRRLESALGAPSEQPQKEAPRQSAPANYEGNWVIDLCPHCDGSGEEIVSAGNGPDAEDVTINCTHCKGHGGLMDAYRFVVANLEADRADRLRETGERMLATPQQPAQGQDARDGALNIEAAAKMLAERMDYPWESMPEKGRGHMRKHAQAVISAAMQQQGGDK